MEIKLYERPKEVTLIEGFPGFGLVGSIATEFLIEHLKTEQIGKLTLEDMPPVAAIHQEKLIEPMAIHYNKKYNLLIIHVITNTSGYEWKMAQAIRDIAKELEAKEIISIEGVAGRQNNDDVYYYSTVKEKTDRLESIGLKKLKEGIIMGITAGLLLKSEKIPLTCLFAETHSNMPDSKAAAEVIKALDKYLGLKVDYHPLVESAERFEANLKSLMAKSKEAEDLRIKKSINYVG